MTLLHLFEGEKELPGINLPSFQGLLYTVTDVKDLHEWMVQHLAAHQSFQRLTLDEEKSDILHDKLLHRSEEAQKVERNQGEKFLAIFRRL